MSKSLPEIEEIVEYIKRSQILNVIVEGKDDVTFYEKLEDDQDMETINFLPLKGRDFVLKVYEELSGQGVNNVIYVVDSDLWIHTGTPDKYNSTNVLLTYGYSIENDLLLDLPVENMMSRPEKEGFQNALDTILPWYACQVEKVIRDEESHLSRVPKILVLGTQQQKDAFLSQTEFHQPDTSLVDEINSNIKRYLRGKTLLGMILLILDRPGRSPRHQGCSILDFAASQRGTNFTNIKNNILRALDTIAPQQPNEDVAA